MKNQQLVEFIINCDKTSICQSPKNILIKNGFSDYTFLVDDLDYQQTKRNLFSYAYGDAFCMACGKKIEIIDPSWNRGWRKTCGPSCTNSVNSSRQLGSLNSCHKMSQEQKNIANNKTSVSLKNKILNDGYTPKSENYKTFKLIYFKHNDEIRHVRSLWELIYWLQNPTFEYEKVRIQYFDGDMNKDRIYITDFYDGDNTIIEIKPKKYQETLKYKTPAVLSSGYNYVILDEDYFKKVKYDDIIDDIKNSVLDFELVEKRLKWLK